LPKKQTLLSVMPTPHTFRRRALERGRI
jgi:hypothetical protein